MIYRFTVHPPAPLFGAGELLFKERNMRLYVIKHKGGHTLGKYIAVAQDWGIYEGDVYIPLWGLKAFFRKKDAEKRLSLIKYNEYFEIGVLESVERKKFKKGLKK